MKTKITIWATALIFSFLFSNVSIASHLYGGEMTWECHPTNGQYRIITKLYSDCSSPSAPGFPGSVAVSLSNGAPNITANFVGSHQVSFDCYDPTASISCGSNNGAFKVGIFKSAWVSISNIPATGLELFCNMSTFLRTSANVTTSSFALRAVMYPVAGSSSCNNNSPVFLEEPLVRACTGELTTFNPNAVDVDNDSLYVKLASAISQQQANSVYTSGYSATNPFPDANKNALNTPLSVNPNTGAITFKSYTNGLFIGVYEIEEWRQGVLISRTFRDAPTLIGACTMPGGLCFVPPNTAPSFNIEVDSVLYPNGPFVKPVFSTSGNLKNYEVNVSVGDTVNSLLTSSDLDFHPNCMPQQILFSASGIQLSNDTMYANSNMCLQNGPCATLLPMNGPGGTSGGLFSNPGLNTVAFQWAIDATHLTYQGLQTNKVSYIFSFNVTDGSCPLPGSTTTTLIVNIEDSIPGPPSLSKSCVNIVASSGDISFNAKPANDTAKSFQGYYVYHSTNKLGPYSVIDTLSNYALSGYTDAGRGPGPNFYFMRTISSMLSPTSDTLALMNLNIQPSPGTPSVVTLNWNAHSSNQNANTYYQVWKRDSYSTPWVILDSTQSLTYVDTPSVILAGLDYKIAIGGTCFSAKMNTIGIEESALEKVTVSPVPFIDEINVVLPEELHLSQIQLELFNISGQRITFKSESFSSNNIKLIDLSDLPHGVYMLHLSSKGKTKTYKLMH